MLLSKAIPIIKKKMGHANQQHGVSITFPKFNSLNGIATINVDPILAEPILLLNKHGLVTEQSCQGETFDSDPDDWKHSWFAYVIFNLKSDPDDLMFIFEQISENGFYAMEFYYQNILFPSMSAEILIDDIGEIDTKFMAERNKRFCHLIENIAKNIDRKKK